MQDLVEHHISVGEGIPCDEIAPGCIVPQLEMRLDGLEIMVPRRLLMLGVGLVLLWVEEGLDEEGTP